MGKGLQNFFLTVGSLILENSQSRHTGTLIVIYDQAHKCFCSSPNCRTVTNNERFSSVALLIPWLCFWGI